MIIVEDLVSVSVELKQPRAEVDDDVDDDDDDDDSSRVDRSPL